MKAVVWTTYGSPDVLQLREVKKPIPKSNDVLIRVHATTVFAGDAEMRALKIRAGIALMMRLYAGVFRPRRITILGQELAGEIEAVGKDVTRFKSGDQVFGTPGFSMGAYAEYACVSQDGALALKPSNMTYLEAAAVTIGGLEALHFLRQANIQHGQSVLINGAGGSIGTVAVQLAKHYGAEVTAVDIGEKLDMLREIGADHVMDYTEEDFAANGVTYDVIFDVVGKRSINRTIRSLSERGYYLIGNPGMSHQRQARRVHRTSRKTVFLKPADQQPEDLLILKDLIEAGAIRTVIDRCYPLEALAEAHYYVDSGLKQGNVVIAVTRDGCPG